MNAARSLVLVALLAASVAIGAARNADAQSSGAEGARESLYLGSALSLARMSRDAITDITDRLDAIDDYDGWGTASWEDQIIADAGVLNAVYQEWLRLEAPDRYVAAHVIFLRGAAAESRAGTHLRQGIATSDKGTSLLAWNDLAEGAKFDEAGADLLTKLSRAQP